MATLPIPFPARNGRPRAKVDPRKILKLRHRGLSWREIAKGTGLPTTTCVKACQRLAKGLPKYI